MSYRIGVDIGGTFTDVVLLGLAGGRLTAAKAPTDHSDPINGILAAWRAAIATLPAEQRRQPAEGLNHATTLATNAIIEGKLPQGALLTTRGFRDVIDIGRIQRPVEAIYDMNIDNPQPLIPRHLRFEVDERIGSRGEVVEPLDEAKLRATLKKLKGAGVRAVAVSGLFSFVNPAHERRIAEILAEDLPGAEVSISSAISPEMREFERTTTTIIDVLLKPIMAPYLKRLAERLRSEGIPTTRIMLASGGLTTTDLAAARPVGIANSGPSAGVIASANLGRRMGIEDLVTIDMGGTSLDIGTVENGRPVQRYESKIAGYPIRMPMIDVAAVAAGGGSIAQVDNVGYVQVSRESAGSVPGPACYGRGGLRPTITDADLVLGRLGLVFGGTGGFKLDREPAARTIRAEIADRLKIDVEEAAAAVLRIIQARMVKAISSHTLEKGLDVRDLPLLVYGGAGPTHGVELADAMSMSTAVIPYLAGNFSAIGLLVAPLRWDESRMVLKHTEELKAAEIGALVAEMDGAARKRLVETGADLKTLATRWLMHMRYADQAYDVPVDLGEAWSGTIAEDTVKRLAQTFDDIHFRRYAYRGHGEAVECVQLRVSVAGREVDFPTPDVVIKESQDLSCCIFDRDGRVVVQSNHAPMLLAGSAYTIEAAIEQLGARGFEDGDIVMANDPYRGGQHLMDVMMISPVFIAGEHVGYVSCLAHHSDLGGASPGGVAGGLRDIYSEGLCFPFVRAYIGGEENRDLFAMIEGNVRAPYKTLSDMRAQVAACLTGIRRYKETIARFGLAAIESAADMLIKETEERMLTGLDKLPDGEFRGEEWVDDDGVTDEPAHIVVKVIKKGRELIIDLTESSDQVQGNINCPLATAMAAAQYPFVCAIDNTVSANHGMFKALRFKTRKGSILDPVRPAAVAARTNVSLKVQEATIKALAKMLPGTMMAASHGQMTHMAIVGDDPRHHRTFIYNDLAGGGAGARPTKDGRDGQDSHLARFMNTPVEMIEHEFPVRCRRYELVPDTGGAGQYRGALALVRDVEVLTEKALFSRYGDRQKFKPQGLDGGGDGEPGKFILNPGKDDKKLKSKSVDEVKKGDVLRIVTPGGAGYGDPKRRDLSAIAADLADGKTSEDYVLRNYGKEKLFEAKRLLAGTSRAAAE